MAYAQAKTIPSKKGKGFGVKQIWIQFWLLHILFFWAPNLTLLGLSFLINRMWWLYPFQLWKVSELIHQRLVISQVALREMHETLEAWV